MKTSQPNRISYKLDSKNNNFGLLRFVFSIFVLYAHTFILGGFGKGRIAKLLNHQETFATVAVSGFFVISGYLVTKSMINSPSVFAYLIKRFLRIYPGFWACLVVTAFLFAPFIYFFDYKTLHGYLGFEVNGPLHYLKTNITTLMHEYNIAKLLQNNPYKHVFNGSLWTLFIEVKAYLALAIIGFLKLHKNRKVILLIFVVLWSLILFDIPIGSASNKYLRLVFDQITLFYAAYFFAGATSFLYREEIRYNTKILGISLLFLVFLTIVGQLHRFLPIILPYIIFWIGLSTSYKSISKLGDLSYGIYIYAFPVQQLASYFGLNQNFVSYFSTCLIISIFLGFLSWNLVEKPALLLKKHLIHVNPKSIF